MAIALEVEELKSRFRALTDEEWSIAVKYIPNEPLIDEVKRRLMAEQDVIKNVHKAISGKDMPSKDGDFFSRLLGEENNGD